MLTGRWDLTIFDKDVTYPSWAEFHEDGSGWFVGRVGSARPIPHVHYHDENHVRWRLPKQYENRETEMEFNGHIEGDHIAGKTTNDTGEEIRWEGRRAPALDAPPYFTFGDPIELVGADKSNWTLRSPDWVDNWTITPDGLDNSAAGSDLITVDKFKDFRLVAEYRYPAGSNSGIYLRGRYEFQILDDYGQPPSKGSSSAIYGFLQPSENAVNPPGEWNLAEITLLGRHIIVTLNGKTVIDSEEIPGITGGALESDEAAPGPIFLQGDHGPVTFRRLTLYPVQ